MNSGKPILILIPEGYVSATEVNFFNGIDCYTGVSDKVIVPIGLHKISSKKSSEPDKKKEAQSQNESKIYPQVSKLMRKYKDIQCFGLIDGDDPTSEEAAKHAYKLAVEQVTEIAEDNGVKVEFHDLIIPENKTFNDEINYKANKHKKEIKNQSNVDSFNNFCEQAEVDIDTMTIAGWQKFLGHFNPTVYKGLMAAIYEIVIQNNKHLI